MTYFKKIKIESKKMQEIKTLFIRNKAVKVYFYLVLLICIFSSGVCHADIDEKQKVKPFVRFAIAHTNDTHSHIEPFKILGLKNMFGGIARRATLLNMARKQYDTLIYVDSGDLVQGTLFFNFFKGSIEFKMAQKLGLDIMCLGNHEFDKGQQVLLENIRSVDFPVLCANIKFNDKACKGLQQVVKKSVIKEVGGYRILFTSIVTNELLTTTKASNLNGIEVLDPYESIKRVMSDNDFHFVILLSHQGFSNDLKTAKKFPEIDLIIGGHSHTKLSKGIFVPANDSDDSNDSNDSNDSGVWVFQSGQWGKYLGLIEIEITRDSQKPVMRVIDSGLISVDESIKEDGEFKKIIAEKAAGFKKMVKKKIGETSVILDGERGRIRVEETNLGNLTADVIRAFGKTDIAFQNAGAIRSSIRGPEVKVEDVLNCFPFSDEVVTLKLKGSDIEKLFSIIASAPRDGHYGGYLQISGMKVVYNNNKVRDITINNTPLDRTRIYTVATNAFLTQGGDGLTILRDNKWLYRTGVLVSDLVIEHFKNNSPVNAKVEGRIIVE